MQWVTSSRKESDNSLLEKKLSDVRVVYPAVSGATFEKADLLFPPATLLKKFSDATVSMAEKIHALYRKTQNLRRTSNLLLPGLL